MNLYPLKLTPVLKDAIWGGKNIAEAFGIGEKGKSCAEAWMLTLRPDGVNTVENGEYAGKTLENVAETVGKDALYGGGHFPLLIKIIDAADRLSVQVHPDDAYAKANGLDAGKTEMWYILDAKPGAVLVSGIKEGVTPEELRISAENGDCEKYLNTVPVKKGDCFFIPAGLVHAIGEGILIAEIQQNSNTTYRLYDYERTDKEGNKRELHTARAAETVKTSFDLSDVAVNTVTLDKDGVKRTTLCACEYFKAESLVVTGGNTEKLAKNGTMLHVMCVSGHGMLTVAGKTYPIGKGDSYLLPAALADGSVSASDRVELVLAQNS